MIGMYSVDQLIFRNQYLGNITENYLSVAVILPSLSRNNPWSILLLIVTVHYFAFYITSIDLCCSFSERSVLKVRHFFDFLKNLTKIQKKLELLWAGGIGTNLCLVWRRSISGDNFYSNVLYSNLITVSISYCKSN